MMSETPDPKLTIVYRQVDDVKSVMADNLQKAINRGEKLDVLYAKSEELENAASVFDRRSTKLRRMMCMQNAKRTMCVVVIILIILSIIVGIIFASKH